MPRKLIEIYKSNFIYVCFYHFNNLVPTRIPEVWLSTMLTLLLVLICGAGAISRVSSLS